ncbi:MAG: alpha/beta hydrolase [Clostridiales bacterium]|nr:alpha/beta hydrolase [Clostridiales bacterium]
MELKDWTYEELPEFTEPVEGVSVLSTTGDEVGVTYLSDVAYAEVGGVTLHLQILQPGSRNRPEMVCPCVVFVQGSAWFPQNVYTQIPRLSRLAARGYVVAIVEYRHSGLAPFPAQIMDARNAIRFLRKNAALYHIDPDKIAVSGDSSGGHTAMFAGMIHDDERENLYPGVTAEVGAIVNYYGSTSVMAEDSNPITVNHCAPDSPEGLVMGGVDLRDRPDLKRRLSVECNIGPDTVIPPTLIFHGTKDRTVNCAGSVALYRQMKKCGKDVTMYLLQGADHGGPEFWTENVLDIVDAFLRRCLL